MAAEPAPRRLPNSLPRPPEELEQLEKVWEIPSGFRVLSEPNNVVIGLLYVATALLFVILGGILALLMRTQLAVPENDIIGYDTYNQLFTMHGTVMMFLFAVPVVEAVGIMLLPAMLGARDLPFPRLSAYAYWAYAAGGLAFFCTVFLDLAPDGGWFMYPPLTSLEYSPGLRSDFWLLGIGFIEISAIAGAIEIVVGVMRTRPPGMTIDKIPIYAWAMLVVALMIVFGFPPVILATALLELERAFHWPFFIAERGGDPLLWQHLFWLFGHPEVYIIFLPAAGMISMMVPTLAQVRLAGYEWIVVALLATGLISFMLWVHHMFATGLPPVSTGFFSAASVAVAIPAGIQVFAWIATLRKGKVMLRTPTWFLLGFFFIFIIGGLTGVMVAIVPYDWQAHDTYFVVAHLHYVLLGGMVFPVLAGIYYWAPLLTGGLLSERMGKWACALLFIGVNLTFFPMHLAGLLGMPRRIWTYADGLGWETPNLLSTVGAFILAVGFLIVFIDMLMHFRPAGKVDMNPWNAGTLDWLPMDNYAVRSIPHVSSREPLWDNPNLRDEVDQGGHYLPGVATGWRETIVSSPIDARPEYLLRLPGPSWLPLLAGLGTAVFFLCLTVKLFVTAAVGAVIALVSVFRWLWQLDRPSKGVLHDIGAGIRLPDYVTGPSSHAWWATVVLLLVYGSIFASLAFAYFYFWTITPSGWPPSGVELPHPGEWLASGVAWIASSIGVVFADRALRSGESRRAFACALAVSLVAMWIAFALIVHALWQTNVRPDDHAYGAVVYALLCLQGLHVVLLTTMTLYALARLRAGLLDAKHRVTFDNTRLSWHYMVVQGLLLLAIVYSPTVLS